MQRLNIVTLGVKDLKLSKSFFQQLFGWKPTCRNSDEIVFYDMGGWVLALYPWELLAEDATVPPEGSGFSGITLAHNVPDKVDVAPVLSKAESLGATIVKPAQDVFWGGYSGYFRDINEHLWEVAWNPFTPTLSDGTLKIKHEDY